MSEEKKTEEKKTAQPGVSRRNFIAGTVAGLVVGAAAAYGATTMMQPAATPAPTATTPGVPAVGPVDGKQITPTINGKKYPMWVNARWSLQDFLRNKIGLTGTMEGCNLGECGACAVIANGNAVNSCEILAIETDGWQITTIEGLATGGTLSTLQQNFIKQTAFQCGACTPGFIIAAKALLDKKSSPSEDEVREALSGTLCRCSTYDRVVMAVLGR